MRRADMIIGCICLLAQVLARPALVSQIVWATAAGCEPTALGSRQQLALKPLDQVIETGVAASCRERAWRSCGPHRCQQKNAWLRREYFRCV